MCMDFLISILSFGVVLFFCRVSSMCYLSFINRKCNLTIHNKKLAKLLIASPIRGVEEETQKKMGIVGFVAYITLIPSAIYIWIATGKLDYFALETSNTWLYNLYGILFAWFAVDGWLGIFLIWCTRQRKEARERKRPLVSEII